MVTGEGELPSGQNISSLSNGLLSFKRKAA